MRYRLMVFDPALAPSTAAGFLAWARVPTWTENNGSDPGATILGIFAYLGEAQQRYAQETTLPSVRDADRHVLVEHSVARDMIQCVFETNNAHALSAQLQDMAARHGVGFFEISVGEETPVLDQRART